MASLGLSIPFIQIGTKVFVPFMQGLIVVSLAMLLFLGKHGNMASLPFLFFRSWVCGWHLSNEHLSKLFDLEEKSITFLSKCGLVDIRRLVFSNLVDRCMFGDKVYLIFFSLFFYIRTLLVLILTKLYHHRLSFFDLFLFVYIVPELDRSTLASAFLKKSKAKQA